MHKIEEVNLLDQLNILDLEIPNDFTFLPENIIIAGKVEELYYPDTVLDLQKIFRLHNINFKEIDNTAKIKTRKSADWYGPAIFIGFSYLSNNSTAISVALNVLSNYISDFFKGSVGEKNIKMEIYIETKKNTTIKRLTYEGNIQGLSEIERIIKDNK